MYSNRIEQQNVKDFLKNSWFYEKYGAKTMFISTPMNNRVILLFHLLDPACFVFLLNCVNMLLLSHIMTSSRQTSSIFLHLHLR